MKYNVYLDDPSALEGYRYYSVEKPSVDAILEADDQLVLIKLIPSGKETWINRHRVIRIDPDKD